jgi:glycosyltransferase involved in cell wall biosynthesis
MFASVIVATYNHPRWLEKCMWGFAEQSCRDFEIIVADDGSGSETRQVVERLKSELDIPIRHIWHADDGFRKCVILNEAVVASRGTYLIFADGDCIPHPDFVKNHVELARPGTMLSGGAFRLPLDASRAISRQDIVDHKATQPSWLLKNGVPFSFRLAKLFSHPIYGAVLDRLTTTRPTWNGGNASTWRHLVIETNGFDERMQYGGEDREFGERLKNMGVTARQVRYRCSCVHLEHGRDYDRPEARESNRAIRAHTRRSGVTRTPHGIDSANAASGHPAAESAP